MTRSPPSSKVQRMVQRAEEIAEDSTHGYSQKPPSGRWGPDFDCSSLMYHIADYAGYPVGTGRDKVRFTGTMLKDFEKAGFQILPFANVGISDLKIGDILLNLALHAEVYVGEGQSIGALSSETGGFVGDAGDQTGEEITKHPVATFDKGWDYVLRPPSEDEDDEVEEGGDDDMPMYNQPGQGMNGMYSPTTYNPQGYMQGYPQSGMQGYPQGGMNRPMGQMGGMQGYPQGNLGQMNGYSQANAGYPQGGMQGYPQGMENDLCFVMGIEGAKNLQGMPNSRKPVFDEDKAIMYIVHFGPQGMVDNLNVYSFEECSEDMPQHLSPLMQHSQNQNPGMQAPMQDFVTHKEIEELKEMILNAQSSSQQSQPNGSRNGNQQSGSKLNARTN